MRGWGAGVNAHGARCPDPLREKKTNIDYDVIDRSQR